MDPLVAFSSSIRNAAVSPIPSVVSANSPRPIDLENIVKLPSGKYKGASSKGFRILAGYIFGKNQKEEKISMTSPVSMSLEDSMTMMFMVPKNIRKEELPKPNESKIEFTEEPAKKMAAISFGGWANDEKIQK